MRIYLDKTLFQMDLAGKRFAEAENSLNKIPFMELKLEGQYYSFAYDPHTKNIARPLPNGNFPEGTKQIRIPVGIIESGYQEGSSYARMTNDVYSTSGNFRLMDEQTLKELDAGMFKNVRQLPEEKLGDTTFIIDVTYSELREKQNPLNIISYRDMEYKGDHYLLHYDRKRKTISDLLSRQQDIVLIKLRQMVDIDPIGIGEKYGIPLSELPKKDSELQCNQKLLEQRLLGFLPKIKVAEEQYFIDLRLLELRSVDCHFKSVKLEDLYLSGDGEKYFGFYDLAKKRFVDIDEDITAYPKDVVMAVLPHELWLDPVASGRRHLNDPLGYLKRFPIISNQEARLFPLSESPLAKVIDKNIARQQDQQQKNSKGKGL